MTDWIGEIEARAKAAVAGPWTACSCGKCGQFLAEHDDGGMLGNVAWVKEKYDEGPTKEAADANLAFIAAAREDVPRLCATLRAVETYAGKCEPIYPHIAAELRRVLKGEV